MTQYYIYIYIPVESNHRDGPMGHKKLSNMHEKSLQHLQNEMDDCELDLNSTCSYSVYTLKLHTQTCTTIRINNTKQCFILI